MGGCVSTNLLNENDELNPIGIGHHIVSLTSTTYGLLNLDPTTTPPPRITLSPVLSKKDDPPSSPEVINSWELMAGLIENEVTTTSSSSRFRISPLPPPQPSKRVPLRDLENSNSNNVVRTTPDSLGGHNCYEKLCPPNGGSRVVVYTTTLRGVRKTFEECNAVRAAFEGHGVSICERDISMDRGFKEELRELMKGKEDSLPPKVFIKGRYVGGAQEVLRILEEGKFAELVQGLPRLNNRLCGYVCDMCGGVRFLPCFRCNGSCKMVKQVNQENDEAKVVGLGFKKQLNNNVVVVRCSDCNENGLVQCPICT